MAAEIIRPDADDSNPGSWVDDGDGGTNIYQAIDESSPSDTDYIKTPDDPSDAIYVVRFANPGTTPTSYHGRLSYRYRKQGTRTADLRVRLLEGGTVVQEWSHANIGTSFLQADQLIVAEITDWDSLTVEFKGNQSSAGTTTTVQVSWTEITTSEVKTIKATGGDYTTISNWNTNLTNTTYTTAGTVAEGHLFNESYTESGVTIAPSASNLKGVVLTVRAGERHDGTKDSGANIQASANRFGSTIAISSATLHEAVFWLDIDGNAATIGKGILVGGSVNYAHAAMRCLVHEMTHDQNSASRAINIGNSLSAVVANNFIWSIYNTNAGAAITWGIDNTASLAASKEYICNNSVWDVDSTNGTGYGIQYRDSGNQTIQNNVVADCDDDYEPHTTTNCTANTNASTDSGGPALFAGDPVVASTEFTSLSGTINLHLKSGAECIDAGTTLTVPYQARRDIDDDIRTGTWDIGADEFVSATSYNRTISDTLGLSDNVLRRWIANRLISNTLGLSDFISANKGAQSFNRTISDTLGISDNVLRTWIANRLISDTLGISDNVLRNWIANRLISDTLGISDLPTATTGAHNRTISDSLGISDNVQRTWIANRLISDTLGVSDNLARAWIAQRLISDQLGISDLPITQLQEPGGLTHNRTLSDSLGISDNVLRKQIVLRVLSDVLGLSDSFDRVAVFNRLVTDTLAVSDNLERTVVYLRVLADTLGISDSILASTTLVPDLFVGSVTHQRTGIVGAGTEQRTGIVGTATTQRDKATG